MVVRVPVKVSVESSSVIAAITMLVPESPSTTGWPVKTPISSTAGTVMPSVEVAAPRQRLIARCS
ncbi:hypothetical protein D3C86_2221370 [compost metagenome]